MICILEIIFFLTTDNVNMINNPIAHLGFDHHHAFPENNFESENKWMDLMFIQFSIILFIKL